jgi:UDP-N-acetylmuramoylalanine--D-glutamate ligase
MSTARNIAILGFDREGQASYDYFVGLGVGDRVTICDQQMDKQIPEGADSVLGDAYLDNLDRFDILVRTPGLKPSLILDKNPGVAHKITSGTNEFFKVCPTQNIIGVTGTKGKGTTSTLIAKMLEASGKTVHLAGNIGDPMLSALPDIRPDDWVVLELSSFQLIDLQASPHIAVCLMVVPEHLDWHADFEEYVTAKEQLFARQLPGDVAIYYHDNANSQRIAHAGAGQKVSYCHSPGAEVIEGNITIDGRAVCRTDELQLLGEHNWQNVCAAVTAVWYAAHSVVGSETEPDFEAMRSVLTSFAGLPFRLELVRELDGVKYYNDSFGTTPETAIVAIQAFTQPKVIILGGSDKGAGYDELAQAVKDGNVRCALLIGDQASKIQDALELVGFHDFKLGGADMDTIINNATQAAQPGDVVLLSTGCASFGMFQNYKDRGNQFTAAVKALPVPASAA